ncbi:MAG: hypothetical protein VX899_01480 [Myxococcota bacterium]|nr:hypothetical protein [Myxococcota bacterium]
MAKGDRRVDRLFGGGGVPFRRRGIRVLLGIGLPLDLLGLLTCTGVPGLVLTLLALQRIEAERERVRQGQLPLALSGELVRLRKLALGGLGLCAAGFVLQLWLLNSGFYRALLERWSAAG